MKNQIEVEWHTQYKIDTETEGRWTKYISDNKPNDSLWLTK